MRKLGKTLIHSFTDGELAPVLKLVKEDPELFLGVRKYNAIIYHMGGKIMDIKLPRGRTGKPTIKIDEKYFPVGQAPGFVKRDDPREWCENISILKETIRAFQRKKGAVKKEKIIQQKILQSNACSLTKEYIIVDMEYSMPGIAYGRFDFIALRKTKHHYAIALIELKQGPGAFATSLRKGRVDEDINRFGSGIVGHAWNFNKFLQNRGLLKSGGKKLAPIAYLQRDIVNIICDYRALGLLSDTSIPEIIDEHSTNWIDTCPDNIEVVFICANPSPSTRESISKYLGTHPSRPANPNVKKDISESLCRRLHFLYPDINEEDDSIPDCSWLASSSAS